ncbi:hypothetical protein WA026_008658 [Henosepilachna vigintioctopunctata]|uniref:Glucuronosyltransferase n=1 Tax=Henosepilachna vigintioctopunctata TaxID=420089 RepID=A0AAW1UHZ9_9CUCU
MDAYPVIHEFFGNAVHPAMYSFVDFAFGDKLSFFERLINTMLTVLSRPFFPLIERMHNSHIEKYVGKDLPRTDELYRSLSLLIVNANPIFYPIRPSTPATINLGGPLHLEESQPLPKDLQIYLDGAKHGCIYFSFGSTVNSNLLSPKSLEIFRKTFEELAPIKVLWKFENDTLAKKPRNVELKKWLPQQDVLRKYQLLEIAADEVIS